MFDAFKDERKATSLPCPNRLTKCFLIQGEIDQQYSHILVKKKREVPDSNTWLDTLNYLYILCYEVESIDSLITGFFLLK